MTVDILDAIYLLGEVLKHVDGYASVQIPDERM
jgi:hypothetical protein